MIALLIVVPAAGAKGRCGQHPWCNTALSPDARAAMVVAAMTSSEKIDFVGGDSFSGGYQSDPNTHTGVQDGVPRLDVPTVFYTDGPLGPRQGPSTGLPSPMGLAASWNPAMARLYASIVGNEARDKGNDVVFGPTVNIMRTPLGGRSYEAFGEDPFLVTQMTVSWIDAVQAQGVMADVKHFAANNQEGQDPSGQLSSPGAPIGVGTQGSRYLENSVIDDRTLHEVYLPQFEAAVKQAHTATVMCSYNKLNGAYACENSTLLQSILRGQWGFNGYVLADYGAAHNTIESLRNGLDFEPWPPAAYQPTEVGAAVNTGAVSMKVLDEHVRDTLATWFRFGVFDRAGYRNDDAQIDKAGHAGEAHRIEEQAVTVLRNHGGLLPLRASRLHRIAVIGKDANQFVTGGGSGNVTPFHLTTLLDGVRAHADRGATVTYADGSDVSAAVADAKSADVAIVDVGDYYTEGADRQCLTLECPNNNGDQDGLVSAIAMANPRTVVVLESGGPDLTPWRNQVGALAEAWYPGGPGGLAVADVLFGESDPGGRLPVTFPDDPNQIPTAGDPAKYPGAGENVDYKEGPLVGYRWYDALGETPAFPFGFGLSYTTFRYSRLSIARLAGGAYRMRLTVTNSGRRRGWAVPEVYVHVPAAAGAVAPDQLRGFTKISLGPRQHRTVTITLDSRSFEYWNSAAQAWRTAPGCDAVLVGDSSRHFVLRGAVAEGGASCRR